jgi:hypothetical protein
MLSIHLAVGIVRLLQMRAFATRLRDAPAVIRAAAAFVAFVLHTIHPLSAIAKLIISSET